MSRIRRSLLPLLLLAANVVAWWAVLRDGSDVGSSRSAMTQGLADRPAARARLAGRGGPSGSDSTLARSDAGGTAGTEGVASRSDSHAGAPARRLDAVGEGVRAPTEAASRFGPTQALDRLVPGSATGVAEATDATVASPAAGPPAPDSTAPMSALAAETPLASSPPGAAGPSQDPRGDAASNAGRGAQAPPAADDREPPRSHDDEPPELPPDEAPDAEQPPPEEPDAPADATPPAILAVAFEPPTVHDGSSSNLIVLARDPGGMAASGVGSARSPSGAASIALQLLPLPGSPRWFAAARIPAGAEPGAWTLGALELRGRDGTPLLAIQPTEPPLAGVTLQVLSSASDQTPPDVLSVEARPATVEQGGSVTVRVAARDEGSGLRAMGGDLQSPSGAARLRLTGHLDTANGTFTAGITVPADAEPGQWTLALTVTDAAGNVRTVARGEAAAATGSVLVTRAVIDSTPPSISEIVVAPPVAARGATVTVAMRVEDEESGPMQGDATAIDEAGAHALVPIGLELAGEEGERRLVGRLVVPQDAPSGRWILRTITVLDQKHNGRTYQAGVDVELAGAVFDVE